MGHAQAAMHARENKERNPGAYCKVARCLWRTDGRRGFVPCRKHGGTPPDTMPARALELLAEANTLEEGEPRIEQIDAELAYLEAKQTAEREAFWSARDPQFAVEIAAINQLRAFANELETVCHKRGAGQSTFSPSTFSDLARALSNASADLDTRLSA